MMPMSLLGMFSKESTRMPGKNKKPDMQLLFSFWSPQIVIVDKLDMIQYN